MDNANTNKPRRPFGTSIESNDKLDPHLSKVLLAMSTLGKRFSGVGAIFCHNSADVPHVPLYGECEAERYGDPVSIMIDRADISHPNHDGFYIFNEQGQLITANAYVAPAIHTDQPLLPAGIHRGSRVFTALYASMMPGVRHCWTLNRFGELLIFRQGVVWVYQNAHEHV